MRVKQSQIKIILMVSLGLLMSLGAAACQLSAADSKIPATPTLPLDIPVITADTTKSPVDEDAEAVAEAPVAEEEGVVEEGAASPTETPKPQPTAEMETVDTIEQVVYAATPTVIPAKSDENPDPMVYIYGGENCYDAPDMSSKVTGKTQAGTALAAHQRSWNFYQVDHPTINGITCWVTGDSIRPNTEAFALPGPTPLPPAVVTPEATEEPASADEAEEAAEVEEEAAVEPTPTAIPYVTTSNPDAMVIFYGTTKCYKSADTESGVSGVASGGTALAASKRDWNWYQVVHPTTGGLFCWVTGDTIRPNQTAYNLGK